MNYAVIAAILVIVPIAFFLGGFLIKIIWDFLPLIVTLAIGAYLVRHHHESLIYAGPALLLIGVIGMWKWQMTQLYLTVDRAIGKAAFFGD